MQPDERSVEIIREAARHVSPEFIAAHPEIPWRRIHDAASRVDS